VSTAQYCVGCSIPFSSLIPSCVVLFCYVLFVSFGSLRKGANSLLAASPAITMDQRIVAGGWAAANTSDRENYKEVTEALTEPPFRALAGFPDPCRRVHPMRIPINSLSPAELNQVIDFRTKFFASSFRESEFQVLEGLLSTCLAAALMYYPKLRMKFGASSQLVLKVLGTVKSARIVGGYDTEGAERWLAKIAAAIEEDFERRNIIPETANPSNLVGVLNQQGGIINSFAKQSQDTAAIIRQLQEQNKELREALTSTTTKLDQLACAIASSPPPSLRKRTFASLQEPQQAAQAAAPAAAQAAARGGVADILRDGAIAGDSLPLPSDKGVTVGAVLAYFQKHITSDSNKLTAYASNLEDLPYPVADSKNKGKLKASLRVAQAVITPEQLKILQDRDSEPVKVKEVADAIDGACLDYLRSLEQELEQPLSKKIKPFFTGLGQNFQRLEKEKQVKAQQKNAGSFFITRPKT